MFGSLFPTLYIFEIFESSLNSSHFIIVEDKEMNCRDQSEA